MSCFESSIPKMTAQDGMGVRFALLTSALMALVLLTMLAGCGFKLRGIVEIPAEAEHGQGGRIDAMPELEVHLDGSTEDRGRCGRAQVGLEGERQQAARNQKNIHP